MNHAIQLSVFRGLSDALEVCISVQNAEGVAAVLVNSDAARNEGAITQVQFDELVANAQEAGYEFA